MQYYIYNAHGDVTGLTNSGFVLVKSYAYDAYGNEQNPDANDTNPFRYCGEYYDAETGLYYLRNRYYDPQTGRFITEDPIRDGTNWYTYGNNNPILYIDPTGLDSYIFYDPNMFGEGTGYEFALTDKKMLEDYYGTPCHLIDIWSAEGFIYNWNNRIGTDGNGTIDAVVVFSHSYWSTLIFGSGDQSSEVRDVNLDVINSKLESRTMKVLLLLGCHTGETNKDVNLATTFAKNNNIGILVASDGKTFHTEGGTNHTIDSQTVDENGNKRDGFKKYVRGRNGMLQITQIGYWFRTPANMLNAAYGVPNAYANGRFINWKTR